MSHSNNKTEQVLRSSGVDVRKCMRCGKCTATCPAFDEMVFSYNLFFHCFENFFWCVDDTTYATEVFCFNATIDCQFNVFNHLTAA